ncbi:MAG: hypothetical protein KAJ62_01065 [Desulfobacteraceae bacterium]|nr:hypothetical protein [Desulfobacteraceae bacterium]
MKFRHPFEWLTKSNQKRAFFLFLIITLAVMAALRCYDSHLKTEAAPNGIVSYEFAGTLPVAQSMIKSWGEHGQIYAGLSLGLDYLFLIVYACAIGLGCVLIGQKLSEKFILAESIGTIIAWGLIIAALLDAVENYALIKILLGSVQEFWLTIAWFCAAPKFVLVGLGLIYLIFGTTLTLFIKK